MSGWVLVLWLTATTPVAIVITTASFVTIPREPDATAPETTAELALARPVVAAAAGAPAANPMPPAPEPLAVRVPATPALVVIEPTLPAAVVEPAPATLTVAAPLTPPAAVAPPATVVPPTASVGPPAAPAAAATPPPPSADPSTADFSSPVAVTGRISASAARWRRTSTSNAAQPGQRSMCARVMLRGKILPRTVASRSRISEHGLSRASRPRASASRAWKISAFTFSVRTPNTSAISACEWSPSSKSTNAARWSTGKRCTSASNSRSSSRRTTCADGSSKQRKSPTTPSRSTTSCRTRSSDRQRLRAIV